MRSRPGLLVGAAILLLSASVTSLGANDSPDSAEERAISVIETVEHDPTAFTQGLEIFNGTLFESTGLYGHSGLRQIDPSDGRVIRNISIDENFFGEGITIFNDSVIMLTWRNQTALVFDAYDLSFEGEFRYEGEGWGICFNGDFLVMSNGTSELSFRDPISFELSHSISVTWDGKPVTRLNELECVEDQIFANVWLQDVIISIDSTTGKADFFASAEFLSENQGNTANEVLNGIAFDSSRERYWITGKNRTEKYLVSYDTILEDGQKDNRDILGDLGITSTSAIVATFFLFVFIQQKMPNFKDPPSGDNNGDG